MIKTIKQYKIMKNKPYSSLVNTGMCFTAVGVTISNSYETLGHTLMLLSIFLCSVAFVLSLKAKRKANMVDNYKNEQSV